MESWKNAHVRVHKASEEIRQLQLPSSGAGFLYTSGGLSLSVFTLTFLLLQCQMLPFLLRNF